MPPVRVVVADEQPLVRDALALAFADGPDFLLLAVGAGPGDALALARVHAPEVVVLGLGLEAADGLTTVDAVARELAGVRVVVVAADEDPCLPLLALRRGAGGCLTKGATVGELRGAVRAVGAGCVVLDPRSIAHLVTAADARTRSPSRRVPRIPGDAPPRRI